MAWSQCLMRQPFGDFVRKTGHAFFGKVENWHGHKLKYNTEIQSFVSVVKACENKKNFLYKKTEPLTMS